MLTTDSNSPRQIAIVVPCFNEEDVLPLTISSLQGVLDKLIQKNKILPSSMVCFIDDGSIDKTWELISECASSKSNFCGLKLSRNRGHQNALLAGIFELNVDAVITIDADLQDDVNAIEEMIDKFNSGVEIVYGVRSSRDADSTFKRITAQGFYKLMSYLGVDSVYNHADYRLMGKRAISALQKFEEVNLYLRGIVPLLGYKSEIVYYSRAQRLAGESKYPVGKMVGFAIEAITSFSIVPLRLVSIMGIFIFAASIFIGIWVLFLKICTEKTVPGWTSIILPMLFLGGVQIFSIGLIGEYLGRAYIETKKRPRYFISESVGINKE